MKNIIIFLLLFSFTSCLTIGRIERNCDKFAQICVTDVEKKIVIRDTTIYKDRIIEVVLPKDTVEVIKTVTVREDNLAYLPEVHKEFGLIGVDASVYRSVLKIVAYLTDSTILQPIHDTIVLPGAIKEQFVIKTVTVKEAPAFYKFTFYLFLILVLIGIGWVVNRNKKYISFKKR